MRLGARLRGEGRDPSALPWYVSPLGRARASLQLAAEGAGAEVTPVVDDRLREVSFGDWAGYTYDELAERGEATRVKQRKRDKWGFCPPGGESYADLALRVGSWLDEISEDAVVVSHGGVFRVLQGYLTGVPWHEVPTLPAPQDRVAVFGDGRIEFI